MDLEFSKLKEEKKKTLLAFTKEVFTVKLKCKCMVSYGTKIFML